jgi:hypothetical protein
MPYVALLLREPILQTVGALLLIFVSLQTSIIGNREVAGELASGVAFKDFVARQGLLDSIPRSERVVGLNKTHPCFREDQTFVTHDGGSGKPPGFTPVLPKGSLVLSYFQPEYLAKSLEQSPPASIAFDSHNYPPGWNRVLENFLRRHADRYKEVKILGRVLFIRKDLLEHAGPRNTD